MMISIQKQNQKNKLVFVFPITIAFELRVEKFQSQRAILAFSFFTNFCGATDIFDLEICLCFYARVDFLSLRSK